MKKQLSKRIIVFLVVLSLLLYPAAGFSHGMGGSGGGVGGGANRMAVNAAVILTTVVFAIWTLVFVSGLLSHSNLGARKFSHVSRNKVSLIPMIGYLGLVQFTLATLMSNPAALMALSYSKQRKSVASKWSGQVTVNSSVTHGQSKGLANSVDTGNSLFLPGFKIQF